MQAAYLLSFRAATNLVAMAVFVPIVNIVLLKVVRLPSHWADLWIARGSIILTALALFIMGIAAYPALLILGLLVFNLGTGYGAAMRSVSVHVIGGQSSPDVGRLFSVIAIVESLGAMVAGPALAMIFEWGISMGEPWIGMPYIVSAGVFVLMTVVAFMISVKENSVVYAEVSGDSPDALEDSLHGRRHHD